MLEGEIDLAVADELRSVGTDALGELGPRARLDVDMSGVTFIDSSGLGALVSIRNAALAAEREVALVDAAPAILRLFELTGLTASFVFLPPAGERTAAPRGSC